jgi:hypothetical protein
VLSAYKPRNKTLVTKKKFFFTNFPLFFCEIRNIFAPDGNPAPQQAGTTALSPRLRHAGPQPSCRNVAVMPDLIRHPLAVDTGSGFRDQVAE